MENLIDNTYITDNAPELDLSQYSTTTVSGIISQASAAVINYCQVDGFLQSTVTSERDRAHINSAGDLIISFRRRPVVEGDVTAIRLRTVAVNQSLTLSAATADMGSGYIYFIPNPGTFLVYPSNYLISFGRGLLALRGARLFYEVDYTGGYVQTPTTGYKSVPDDLKQATLLMVRDILARRYNPMGMDMFRQGQMQAMTRRNNGLTQFVEAARDLLDQNGYRRLVP